MKVLMIRWKSICEPDMMQGFKENGIELATWHYLGNDVDYNVDCLQKVVDLLI